MRDELTFGYQVFAMFAEVLVHVAVSRFHWVEWNRDFREALVKNGP